MITPRPIIIVGGGIAGLALGIGLRQRGVPVTLWEAGRFPRHRVCGEFISGRGQQTLARLGLEELLLQAGAVRAETAVFATETGQGRIWPLPVPALCLARWTLDALLARRFVELGGELRESTRWLAATFGEGVVRATGRQVHPVEGGWRWCGFKAHAIGVDLEADLEMHLRADGYVGLCRLAGNRVNVCGLFRRPVAAADAPPIRWQDLLRGSEGSRLRERMARAAFDAESFCAVAGLPLAPQRAGRRGECVIGDALTLIPPITGNGMSMALEAAEAALDPLHDYSRGARAWGETIDALAGSLDRAFAPRLAWARALHTAVFRPTFRSMILPLLWRSRHFWRLVLQQVR